ncbi:DUF1572 family protein [Peribacillus butanolivorans]
MYIRGESHTVLGAIERQTLGQIFYMGNQLKDENWEAP